MVMATGKRGRRPAPAPKGAEAADSDGVLYARVPNTLLAALDTWATRLNKAALGPQWSRNDIIRVVLTRAVEERGRKGESP